MRKLFYLIVSIVIFGLIISGCNFHVVPPLGQDGSTDIVKEYVSYKTNLIAGQHTIAGSITVSNDNENLFVTYETIDNWLINKTHLYVDTIVPTKSAPGKFPYKYKKLGGVTTDTYEIPLEDLGVESCDIVYIAAHAELVKNRKKEGGWAEGVKIRPGKDWAMYFNYQVWPCGSEIPELTEAISQEIDLSIGGTVEVTDPENIIYGVKLIIPPMPLKKDRKKLIANITISYIDDPYSLKLPDNRGYLLPPVVINSDILFDAECILEIPYTEDILSNMGLSSNENIKVYYYNYYTSSWEEVSINKGNYKAEIDFDYMLELTLVIEEPNMTYACSTPSIFLPPHGFPQPGDLLYKLSFYGISEGWIPGHVGIYVGEFEKDEEGNPYNVVEALWNGVQRNYYNPISAFSGSEIYMGARQPKSGALTQEQRISIVSHVKAMAMLGSPYSKIETPAFLLGLAKGKLVKGTDFQGSYNCVGLAERAYEIAGVNDGQGLVPDWLEGNFILCVGPWCILTPREQYANTEIAEGYSVSGQAIDSQGVKIPDVSLNLELVSFNDYHPDPIKVTTDSNGEWSSGKLGREWKVTPQKDGYTFEPSTIKVKEDANDINFIGTSNENTVSNVVAISWTDHIPENSQNIKHLINVFWDPYPEASGYKVYRNVNGVVEGEPVYSGPGELLSDKNVVQWHDTNIVVGNTYSYYVVAYGDGWETAPSQETGTINSFLPPIYLVGPSAGDTINNSTPTFEWSPVGSNPEGCKNFGTTELWVKDLTADKELVWQIVFDDMTTFSATYNQDGQASPLIPGHSYGWQVTSYGYAENMEDAISQSEYWEFTFGTSTGSVHNLTKDTYYDTIQAALDDANTNNTIEVADGTYDESITFPFDKVIILQSVNGPSSTIIRGDDYTATVTLDDSLEDITLEGFTITHASGLTGRGIWNYRSNLSINNCIISNNYFDDNTDTLTFGGGINNEEGTLIITESTISGNSASYGGGITNNGTLIITESTISSNSATHSGGGIINNGTLTITGCTISSNSASSGGGIDNNVTLTITASTISDNSAVWDGGICNLNGILTITESTISGNSGYYGCGVFNAATLNITASTISDNSAVDGSGIGIFLLSTSGTITIGGSSDAEKNIICGNYKDGYSPSLYQQIGDVHGSFYEIYKDTNYISAYCE